MKKIVEFLFGKPYKKDDSFVSKLFRFAHVAMAVFYFIMMAMLIVSTIMEPSTIVGLFVGAVFFPLVFRFIYNVIGKFNGLEKEL